MNKILTYLIKFFANLYEKKKISSDNLFFLVFDCFAIQNYNKVVHTAVLY